MVSMQQLQTNSSTFTASRMCQCNPLFQGNILIVKPVGPRTYNPLVSFGIINPPWIHFEEISRGDIVVAKDPTNPNTFICKRVTGLKGDYIPLEHRVINRYVPEGCAWVEGDHAENSRDSRNYGPVPLGKTVHGYLNSLY